jgi:uncharacterized protein (TIGR03083 family)
MVDDELAGLDPFDLLDQEAARLDAFFSGIDEAQWTRPSRCEGWTTRDVLGHLAAGEDYHRACLDGTVKAWTTSFTERGANDLDSVGAMMASDYKSMSAPDVLVYWKKATTENRRRYRERGDGSVDTSIGEYPCRWQGFHVASELATHADDIGVPVTDSERDQRRTWRAHFSRFALAEAKPQLGISVTAGITIIRDGPKTVEVDDDELIEAVMARLDATSRLDAADRELLSTMP